MIDRKAPVLYDRIVVANAIRRYECFWLPAQVFLKIFWKIFLKIFLKNFFLEIF